jgi:hypothetical protein
MFLLEVVHKTPIFLRFARKDVQRLHYCSRRFKIHQNLPIWLEQRAKKICLFAHTQTPSSHWLGGSGFSDGELEAEQNKQQATRWIVHRHSNLLEDLVCS